MAYTLTYLCVNNAYYAVDGYTGTPDNVVIPSTYNDGTHGELPVTSIRYRAFYGCSSLTSITIPNSITDIYRAFDGCSGLTSVYYTGTISEWASQINGIDNLMRSTRTLYINNEPVTNVVLENITEIKPFAFYYCIGLTSITIPDGVTSIGSYAFYGCSNLSSITIPNIVTSIKEGVFYGCSSLTSITIPDGVTSIGNYAFDGCSGLTSVTIPDGVTSIGNYAFYNCSILTSINLLPVTVPTLGTYAFTAINQNAKFYCFQSAINNYKSATNWNAYADKLVGDDIRLYFIMNSISAKNYFVPTSRTIAGIDLQDNITASELKTALSLNNVATTGSSAIPVENGTDNFTTGGAYTELGKKLDKVTTTNSYPRLYAILADGSQSTIQYASAASPSKVVVRTGTSQINVPLVPTDDSHAACKKYVDDAVAGAGGSATLLIETTYSDFVDAISDSELIPGTNYRITDYVTKIHGVYDLSIIGQSGAYLPYATSAEHAFDLIVTATGENTYNENVKAIQHAGDTYFEHSNLAAWEIKWTHLNDDTIYSFADTENGKGVIYYMRDEFDNIAFYDFKNIMNLQFGLRKVDNSSGKGVDFKYDSFYQNRYGTVFDVFNVLQGEDIGNNLEFDVDDINGTSAINLLVAISDISIDTLDDTMDWTYMLAMISQMMGTTVTLAMLAQLLGTTESALEGMTEREVIETFFNAKFYYTFNYRDLGISEYDDFFDSTSYYDYDNQSDTEFYGGSYCHSNHIGRVPDILTTLLDGVTLIPNGLPLITFEKTELKTDNYGNIFHEKCMLNVFGANCIANTFGSSFWSNRAADLFVGNSFGNECFGNFFEDHFEYNSFGNHCIANKFEAYQEHNSFGHGFENNSFGTVCSNNSFGNHCNNNIIGDSCNSNSFGNSCSYNSLGNACDSNSFGNSCSYNIIGTRAEDGDWIIGVMFENAVNYVFLTSDSTASSINILKHIKICQGVHGSSSANKLTITATRNLDYQVEYKANNSKEIILGGQ